MGTSYEFIGKVLNTLTEQISVIDNVGNIIYVNKSWIDFSQNNDGIADRNKWENINYLDVTDHAAAGGDTIALEASKGIRSVINGEKEVFYLEYPCHSPSKKRWFMMRATSFFADDFGYYVLSHQNITERKLAEEELSRNFIELKNAQHIMLIQSRQAAINEIIKMIAHQWRQPLATISAVIMNIQAESELEPSNLNKQDFIENELETISNITQNLSKIINDFIRFSDTTKSTQSFSFEEVCVSSIDIINSSLQSDNIEIIYDFKSNKKFDIILSEMMQVVLNIINNSMEKFKEKNTKNPKIKISTNHNCLSICDNGGGIDDNIIEKIFEPYFTTKSQLNGMGLGLYMSRIIIENHHNGSIEAVNTDSGVCINIKL